MKDVLVFGTVIVSVVSAWGMIHTRISLMESSIQTLKDTNRQTLEVQNTKISKLETEIESFKGQLDIVKDHTREIESSLRRYAYTVRRMQNSVPDK